MDPLANTVENNVAQLLKHLRGVLLPSTTPFRVDERIDKAALTANLNAWLKTGVSGFVILGSTGERVHLNECEYAEVIETSRSVVPADFAFIVGAGQQSTFAAIAEIKVAANLGADAVLVLTPNFYRGALTQSALTNYFTTIADAVTIPMLLYSMPALTGVKIEPETIARLSEHSNIIGVKDSSNDLLGFSQTVQLCPPDFAVMTGNGTVFLDALKSGATGGILAVGCSVPAICLEILRRCRLGETQVAEELQRKLTPFAAAVTTGFGIGGLKAALDLAGYAGGAVRAPLSPPTEGQRSKIAELLREVQAEFSKTSAANFVTG